MSIEKFWGKAGSITEAAKLTRFSRVSLHKWKREGCPAFQEDGSVDLSALTEWLRKNGLGTRGIAAEEWTFCLKPDPVYFAGGRDYAAELEGLLAEARRYRELLEVAGEREASEKFRQNCYSGILTKINEFARYLESVGLAEPLSEADEH